MIVYRATWIVREGKTEAEAMELFKEFPPGGPKAVRVLGPTLGSPHRATLMFDFEFADMGACEREWHAWLSDMGGNAFMDRWFTVCERNSGKAELWQLLQ